MNWSLKPGAIFHDYMPSELLVNCNTENKSKYLKAFSNSLLFEYTDDTNLAYADIISYKIINENEKEILVIEYKCIWDGNKMVPYSLYKY